MSWEIHLAGFIAGLVIATLTTPVGISGAMFLLPVQLEVLRVPSPQVTPTNLLFNVVAIPGALARYARQGQLATGLTRTLIVGTLPGVVIGALVRVYLLPDIGVFRVLVAVLLLPTGVYILSRTLAPRGHATSVARRRPRRQWHTSRRTVIGVALVVGVVGGIYGIGGGSILGPILVGAGLPLSRVAPAALASTFLTSVVGAVTYAVISLTRTGPIAPVWTLGLVCGLGGLIGGYAGARLQPRVPETALRIFLGTIAIGLAVTSVVQAV